MYMYMAICSLASERQTVGVLSLKLLQMHITVNYWLTPGIVAAVYLPSDDTL